MLKVENLSASYGGIRALKNVSLEVNEGEIVSVLGANGAGKSTLLKCISAMMRSKEGSVSFCGNKIPSKPYDVIRLGLVQVPEGRKIFSDLTVAENLRVGAIQRKDIQGIKNDMEYVYSLFPRLKEREKQYGGLLSGGEQQMLAMSRGLMARPKLLMLDEPSLGLAPIIVNQIMHTIESIRKNGTAVLLVEQNANKALAVSDRAYLLSVGTVEREASSAELLADDSLIKSYLGN